MAEIEQIKVNGESYDIADTSVRKELELLKESLNEMNNRIASAEEDIQILYGYHAQTAFAVYSADDGSLRFYVDEISKVPSEGGTYRGRTATNVYEDVENTSKTAMGQIPWASQRTSIKLAVTDDSFLSARPKSTAYWFYNATACESVDLTYLDMSESTSMAGMFSGCSALKEVLVGETNTSNVTEMNNLCKGCTKLSTFDVSGFDTSNITNMDSMFEDCWSLLKLDVSGFNTSKVTSMMDTFYNCSMVDELDVSGFDTSKVESMSWMFFGCMSVKSLDISGFKTSNVYEMLSMFSDCGSLVTIYSNDDNFIVPTVPGSYFEMFYNCYSLVGGNGTTQSDDKATSRYAHVDTASNPGYFTAK